MDQNEKLETAIELLRHIKRYRKSQRNWESQAKATIFDGLVYKYRHRAEISGMVADRLQLRYNKLIKEL